MYTKHFRTFHLPWSEGISSDDKVMKTVKDFHNKDVIITEKRDGECTTLYSDGYVHARSINGNSYAWQDVIKAMWKPKAHLLPKGWRLVGENLRANHSISYKYLSDWIEFFAIIDDTGQVLSHYDMIEWFNLLEIHSVPVLLCSNWNKIDWVQFSKSINTDKQEGYVVRVSEMFSSKNWSTLVGKWVRKNHVQSDTHWRKTWYPNMLYK